MLMNRMKSIHGLTQGMFMLLLSCLPAALTPAHAQNTEKVNGSYTLEVSDNDNMTLREAKDRCIELAKAQALREKFGSLVASDIIESNVETNDGNAKSQFWENTVDVAQGEWLEDTKSPLITASYADGKLIFKAEVWGEARKIERTKTDIKWSVMHKVNGKLKETETFDSGENLYVGFKSPSSGYVAIYLVEDYETTWCLLPYRKDETGRFEVAAGRSYTFFDKSTDENARVVPLTTKRSVEANTLYVIYSPKPFTKCTDEKGGSRLPNKVSTVDFKKWLLKNQRADRDMMVEKKLAVIRNENSTQ